LRLDDGRGMKKKCIHGPKQNLARSSMVSSMLEMFSSVLEMFSSVLQVRLKYAWLLFSPKKIRSIYIEIVFVVLLCMCVSKV
jgi:hypothetical protein